jgi:alginate O-acetyltransferase complex protein AlgI
MLFNSFQLLYFFFPVTYFVFLKLTSKKQRYVWLTVSGYVFYSFWNYKFCLLMALSTAVSYFAGLGFLRWKTHSTAPHFDIILPIGISFYTFHTITYIVDSFRGTIVPTRNLFEFACYVSFFPQLVAGPIVRFRQVEGDLERIDHPDLPDALERGISFFTLGLTKKVLIADSIAMLINPALENWSSLSSAGA